MPDLSVIIPAHFKEPFTRHTVEDVLLHLRGNTEIILVSDGGWPSEPMTQHPRVTILETPVAIGQRAAVNQAARLSNARYIMKLDSHCAVSEGFDLALIAAAQELGDEVTQIPVMKSLHVFDWRCERCGATRYQGPRPAKCGEDGRTWNGPTCGKDGPFERIIIWNPERKPAYSWSFDSSLVFGQFGHYQYTADFQAQRPYPETMSCIGAGWFLSRDRFWQLGGMDLGHGGWGQMGTELACKSWLSGGRMITNMNCSFSHMFRPSGGEEWGFTFAISGGDTDIARSYSRQLWLNNAWPQQVRGLRWLIERFKPVPNWSDAAIDALPTWLARVTAA